MAINVEAREKVLVVDSPYHPDFPATAKQLGGKYNAGSKTWSFDQRDEARLRALLLQVYGEDGRAPAQLVTVRLRLSTPRDQVETTEVPWYRHADGTEHPRSGVGECVGWRASGELVSERTGVGRLFAGEQSVFLLGRRVAYQPDRDSAVRLGDGVVVVTGGLDGGGSRKSPRMSVQEDTVLEVREVPAPLAEELRSSHPGAVEVLAAEPAAPAAPEGMVAYVPSSADLDLLRGLKTGGEQRRRFFAAALAE